MEKLKENRLFIRKLQISLQNSFADARRNSIFNISCVLSVETTSF
jgi:hypothetical protein